MRMRNLAAFFAALVPLIGIALGGCNKSDDDLPEIPTAPNPVADQRARPTSYPTYKPTSVPVITDFTAMDIKGSVVPDKLFAKIIQTVVGFNHPQAVAISRDGKFLYVTNSAAMGPNGMLVGGGSISKLAIGDDGRLTLVKHDLTTGLTCPMGIALSTKDTKKFPAGTLFVSTGMTWGCDEKGDAIAAMDKFKPGVTIIDSQSGQILATIPMGPKTAVAQSVFHTVVSPNGLTFDRDGDLYICDSGNTGQYLDPVVGNRPGVLRIKLKNVDSFTENAAQGNVDYMHMRYVPVAILDSPLDPGLYFACAGEGLAGGSVWRMEKKDYPQEILQNVAGALGPLTGLGIAPNKALYMSRQDGDIALITSRVMGQLRFVTEEQPVFKTPGDFRLLKLANGQVITYLPEQDPGPIDRKQRLRVILMPAGN